MNEKERDQFWSKTKVESNKKYFAYESSVRIQADIARQLTRIADQGKPKEVPTAHYCICGRLQPGKNTPTPDALVEAVKKAEGQIDNLLLLRNPTQADLRIGIRDCWETLESGLNAHEKAGG